MVLTFFKVLLSPRLYAICLESAVRAAGSRFESLTYRPNGWEEKGQTILTSVSHIACLPPLKHALIPFSTFRS